MPEYIERETVVTKVKTYIMPNVDIDGTVSIENAERYFLNLLAETPAVDVVEVKHGEWVKKPSRFGLEGFSTFACSVCDKRFTFHPGYDFCPGCGADMREGVENGN